MSSPDLSPDNPPDTENTLDSKGRKSSETYDEPQKQSSKSDSPTKATTTTGGPRNPGGLDISNLAISTEPGPNRRPSHPLPVIRSVSDTGTQRVLAPRIESSRSSGNASPLAHVQAARSGGLAARPPTSSGSSGSISGGVSKLPAGMQAKMMAVLFPRRSVLINSSTHLVLLDLLRLLEVILEVRFLRLRVVLDLVWVFLELLLLHPYRLVQLLVVQYLANDKVLHHHVKVV
jgi:hypothetical protein